MKKHDQSTYGEKWERDETADSYGTLNWLFYAKCLSPALTTAEIQAILVYMYIYLKQLSIAN